MVYKARAYWVGMGFFSSFFCRLAPFIARHSLDDQPAKSKIFWSCRAVVGGDFGCDFCLCDLVIDMQYLQKNNVASEVKTRQKAANNRNVWVIHEDVEPIFNAALTSAAVILC